MFNVKVDVKFDEAALKKQMIEAAEKQLQEKIRSKGLYGLRVKAKHDFGEKMEFELNGPEEEIKKASEIVGS